MNTSILSLKKEITDNIKKLKTCDDYTTKMELHERQKLLLDALHIKKKKTREQLIVRKIKKAESKKPVEPKQPVKIVIKEVPVEIIKEVAVEVPVEVIVVKEVLVNAGGGIPTTLQTDEFIALLNDVRQVYIKSNTDLAIGDAIKTNDGVGIIKLLHVDETELSKKGGGIYAKVKRVRLSDGKEGQRYMGADARGYKLDEMEVVDDVKLELGIV